MYYKSIFTEIFFLLTQNEVFLGENLVKNGKRGDFVKVDNVLALCIRVASCRTAPTLFNH